MAMKKNDEELHRIRMYKRLKRVVMYVDRSVEYVRLMGATVTEGSEEHLLLNSAIKNLNAVRMDMSSLEIKL